MLLCTSTQRIHFGLAELPRRSSGLQCRLCDWRPPPRWRTRSHGIDWFAIYDEHMRVMHMPHAADCFCVECVR